MCGITGIITTHPNGTSLLKRTESATASLHHRGPDHQQVLHEKNLALGHARLSIIDLDTRAHQPMTDTSGRYTLVFNGEIYNFRELRQNCEQAGFSFRTESDTEVLLVMYIMHGAKMLEKLQGFFAFCIYDREEEQLFIARDRMGIKPLVYYQDEHTLAFASELKALLEFPFERQIDKVSLFTYLKLNYIPAPHTILQSFHKLEPGHSLTVRWQDKTLQVEKNQWYQIPYDPKNEKELSVHDYKQSQKVLKRFVRESVRKRLIADVPVGTFLSGGIDSSLITTIAAEEKPDIESFSIGFPDYPFYDETHFAKLVAKKTGVKQHIIEVTREDMIANAEATLNALDEPFADSSAMNVKLLSEYVRKHVKVALSGDGGDELFGGYQKHQAEYRLRYPTLTEHTVGRLAAIWDRLPASRSGTFSNTVRQLQKFADGYQLNVRDRYWRWAGILKEEQANYFLKEEMLPREQRLSDHGHDYKKRKDHLLRHLTKNGSFNEVLLSDAQLVLPNDMLFKVDSMSMAHSLEIRTPLLDQHLVKFAFRLPVMFKVNNTIKKKILQDTFQDVLPAELYNRPKKGFEVPLLEWMQGPLKSQLMEHVFDQNKTEDQGIFNWKAVQEIQKRLFSSNPGDSASTAWALLVFQRWYNKYMS